MNIEKELLEYLYVKLPSIIALEMHESTKGCVPRLGPGHMLYKNWGENSRGSAEWLKRVARWEASNTMLWLAIETTNTGYMDTIRIGVQKPRTGTWSRKGSGCLIPVFFSAISPDLLVYLKSLLTKGMVYVPTEHGTIAAASPEREYYEQDQAQIDLISVVPNSFGSYTVSQSNGNYFAIKNTINKQETNKMQKLVNDMVTANKEALNVAAKLSVGKTANSTLLAALTSKLPWYAKLFGGKKDLMENPLARVASAQLAVALSKHFAPRNEKLAYVADAMLQESMVELITNGEQLQSLITQLEALAGNVTGETK